VVTPWQRGMPCSALWPHPGSTGERPHSWAKL
jgi:hypothetical protein